MTLDAMNNSGLHLTWKTLGHELKALDAMNSSGLWMTWVILGLEHKTLGREHYRGYKQLSAMVDMNDPVSWVEGFRCYE